jgi:hypothetical protein
LPGRKAVFPWSRWPEHALCHVWSGETVRWLRQMFFGRA